MHSGIILLAACSVALIVVMVTCFVCFIRSRRKEDEEFMREVEFSTRQQQHEYATQMAADAVQHQASAPSSLQVAEQAGGELLGPAGAKQSGALDSNYVISQQQHPSGRQSPYSAAAAAYAVAAASSPYHSQQGGQQARAQETRSDITQQINSAIIGSSEAEFQNDFIQVFPMYQIAPQPEKNTTPYLT